MSGLGAAGAKRPRDDGADDANDAKRPKLSARERIAMARQARAGLQAAAAPQEAMPAPPAPQATAAAAKDDAAADAAGPSASAIPTRAELAAAKEARWKLQQEAAEEEGKALDLQFGGDAVGGDEDDAHVADWERRRRYQRDMGHEITPFNVKEEREAGMLDRDDEYQAQGGSRDPWLANLEFREECQDQSALARIDAAAAAAEAAAPPAFGTKLAIFECLLQAVRPNENVNDAVKRMSRAVEADRKAAKKAGRKINQELKKMLDRVAQAATEALGQGEFNVYRMTRRQLAGDYKDEVVAERQWEIRWSVDDTAVHGPFLHAQMQAWQEANYLAAGWVRVAGETDAGAWVAGSTCDLLAVPEPVDFGEGQL